MLYYEFFVSGTEKFPISETSTGRHDPWIQEINLNADALNRKLAYNVDFFVIDIKAEVIHLCGSIGYKSQDNPLELALNFTKDLGFKSADQIKGWEISIHNFAMLLHKSYSHGLIDDDDVILAQSSIGSRSECLSREYSEFLAEEDYTRDKAINDAIQTNCGDELINELERIYQKDPSRRFMGHPVHYFLFCDDWEITEKTINILVSALYYNSRLRSRRVAVMRPRVGKSTEIFDVDEKNIDLSLAEPLWVSQKGATFVIKPGNIEKETMFISETDNQIEDIARLIEDNSLETLSIVVFNKYETQIAECLKLNLPKTRIVEIKEQAFPADRAVQILKTKANEDGIEKIDSLLDKIGGEEKHYYISDVNKIYSQWLIERLSSEVYTQYSSIKLPEVKPAAPLGSAYEKLQGLIGLESAKKVISNAIDYHKAQTLFLKAGINKYNPSRHMVFMGNPGTAKTTVARLFAQIMKDNGVLSKGDLIEVGRQDLVGKYVGWTANLVKKAFIRASGSVLFIDEAYSLYEESGGLFGDEAINTIVQLMENNRTETVVIFAGYPDKMKKFISKNPGLRSRIAFTVNFDDYNADELVDIFKLMAVENNILLDNGVSEKIHGIFENAMGQKDFGNGRYARNVFEQARMNQASRLLKMDNLAAITNETIRTLIPEDFSNLSIADTAVQRTMGFSCQCQTKKE